MSVVVTKDIDKGYKKGLEQIKGARRGPTVAVGFQGAKGQAAHPDGDGATVADVATFNEFGTKTIPERSFIRSTMDENEKELLSLNNKLFFLIATGKMTAIQALNILGLKIKSLIQKKITDLKSPPNKASTIRRKGSSNPLIDSGVMRGSVTHQVRGKGAK